MSCEIKNKIKRKRSLWTERTEDIFKQIWEEKIDELKGKKFSTFIEKFNFSFFLNINSCCDFYHNNKYIGC